MSTYKVKVAHDVALVSLVDLAPQPDPGPLIQFTERHHAASGSVNDQGPYVEFTFSALADTAAYTALLTQFGLHNAKQADVTVYVRDDLLAWVRMNGKAIRPRPGESLTWGDVFSLPLDVKILVVDLEAAA